MVGFRASEPTRERAWSFTRRWYEPLGLDLHVADSPGVFSKARSLNIAAEEAGDWDVAVVLDADCIVPLVQVRRAVNFVATTGRSAWPFRSYRRLTRESTRLVLGGASPDGLPYGKAYPGDDGGAFVVPRRLWEWLGGLDPRLIVWGGEDNLLAAAARCLSGEPAATRGSAYHLWHVPSIGSQGPEWPAVRDLIRRYRLARFDRDSFLAIRREVQASQ